MEKIETSLAIVEFSYDFYNRVEIWKKFTTVDRQFVILWAILTNWKTGKQRKFASIIFQNLSRDLYDSVIALWGFIGRPKELDINDKLTEVFEN